MAAAPTKKTAEPTLAKTTEDETPVVAPLSWAQPGTGFLTEEQAAAVAAGSNAGCGFA